MRTRQMMMMVLFVFAVLAVVAFAAQKNLSQQQQMDFSDLVQSVEKGDVKSLSIKGSLMEGTLADGTRFVTTGPPNSDYYLEQFGKKGVVPDFQEVGDSLWVSVLMNGLVVIVVIGLFMVVMRQLQMGSGKAMSFGKSKAKLLSESGKRITFADVAGCDEAKEELDEIIQFLKDPRKFTRLGGRIPKGVLLMGSPGTGKTLLARAVAGEAGVPFFSISGSEFVEMFVGVGASRVRDLFEQGKKQAPCIIFIDEIDAVGRHRGNGMGGGHDEREQTLNQLLVEMDGFDSAEGVILVAATNRPDVLDPALLRPGRFDRRVVVPQPDVRGRLGILQVHARRTPLDEQVDLERIARGTPGFSGAELESLINEAALFAARTNKRKIDQEDLEMAKDKVAMGSERRSLVLSDAMKKRTAYHEAGHAIVARLTPESDPVNKITIIPRTRSLGATHFLPIEDRWTWSISQLKARITCGMGGRAAEEIIYGDFDTGASDDIKKATQLAHGMVCEYGMSDAMGPVAWGERKDDGYLGRDGGRSRDYSEATAQRIDEEVKKFVGFGYENARTILVQNLHILHKVAQSLIEKESLDAGEFERLVAQMNPVYPEPTSNVA